MLYAGGGRTQVNEDAACPPENLTGGRKFAGVAAVHGKANVAPERASFPAAVAVGGHVTVPVTIQAVAPPCALPVAKIRQGEADGVYACTDKRGRCLHGFSSGFPGKQKERGKRLFRRGVPAIIFMSATKAVLLLIPPFRSASGRGFFIHRKYAWRGSNRTISLEINMIKTIC